MKTLRHNLPFMIGLLTGFAFFNLNITYPYLSHLPGDLGDTRFNMYLLEHAYRFFTGKTELFWNAPFLYPEKDVITYSDNLLGAAPFYAFFRMLGNTPETSFQFWFMLMSVLNYSACYIFLYYLFQNRYAAVLGAMVFAFSIALQSQMPHAQTFPRFAVPLALMFATRYLRELKPGYLFLTLFFLIYQFYCGFYLGFMLMVPVVLLLLLSIVYNYKNYKTICKRASWWLGMAGAVILIVLLLLPLLLPYLDRARHAEFYAYEKVVRSLPTICSVFYAHDGSLFWGALKDLCYSYPNFWDHQIFAGGLAMISFICLIAIICMRLFTKKWMRDIAIDPIIILLFSAGLCTFFIFIRFGEFSLYKMLYPIPGFASMRALQRIVNVELVFYAISSAFVFSLVLKEGKNKVYWGFAFCLLLVVLDNRIRHDYTDRFVKAEAETRVADLVKKMRGLKPGSVISYEPDTIIGSVNFYQLDAMLASQALGLKCLNGYTANSPPEYSFYWENPDKNNRLRWLNHKGLMDTDIIVIH